MIKKSYVCKGAQTNCSIVDEEVCICFGREPSCLRISDFGECGFIESANEFRKCIADNNCAYERDLFRSWELNVLDRNTCIGRYCGDIVLRTVCCAVKDYVAIKYSDANIGPLNCYSDNTGLNVVLALLFIFIGAVIVVGVVAIVFVVVYLIIKRRKQQEYFTYENQDEFQTLA
jgi:hypothetical protein